MNISKTTKGIATAGLPNSLRAMQYSRLRDDLEKQYGSAAEGGEFVTVNRWLKNDMQANGALFRFDGASLDVCFLADDVVRVVWTPGEPPAPYAVVPPPWPAVNLIRNQTLTQVLFGTSVVSVSVDTSGVIVFSQGDDQIIHEALTPARRGTALGRGATGMRGGAWRQRARLQPGERIYGLGARASRFNLRGGVYRLWNQDVGGAYTTGQDPLYLSIPVYLGQHAGGSYLIFYDNTHAGKFDLRGADESVMEFEKGALLYYCIIGPPAHVLERYTELTGRPALPPRWGLGYHHAVIGYKNEANVYTAVEGFRQNNLPLNALHLDLDYTDNNRAFTVDARRFGNLKALASKLAERNTRLVASVDASIKVDDKYPRYLAGVAEKVFCTLPDGELAVAPNWAGWAVFPDLTDPKAREWWGQQYTALFDLGVAGLWHDLNEPTAFTAWGDRTLPLPTRHALEGRGGNHAEAHNVYALNVNRVAYEALQAARPNHRPWQITRSGFAGIQRYAWSWTGEVESSWQGLRQTVPTVLGLSLSGQPYAGADIGGFQGNASPELFTRWFQLGTFLPLCRTRANFANPRREPWQYGEPTLTTLRTFLQLRQRLLPYWYTLAWEASQIGLPLIRPLFWLDRSEAFWDVDDAFLIGDALLAAPILEEGATAREVLLPGGQLWYSFWNDALHTGGGLRVKAPAPLERMPLYVRAGSVLPMEEKDTLVLHVYAPLEGAHTSMVFCDSGDGYGEAMVNYFQLQRSGSDLELFWERDGSLALPYTNVRVHVHGTKVVHAWGDDDSLVCANNVVTLTRPCNQLILASH